MGSAVFEDVGLTVVSVVVRKVGEQAEDWLALHEAWFRMMLNC